MSEPISGMEKKELTLEERVIELEHGMDMIQSELEVSRTNEEDLETVLQQTLVRMQMLEQAIRMLHQSVTGYQHPNKEALQMPENPDRKTP